MKRRRLVYQRRYRESKKQTDRIEFLESVIGELDAEVKELTQKNSTRHIQQESKLLGWIAFEEKYKNEHLCFRANRRIFL